MPAESLQASVDLPNQAYLLPQAVPMWPPVWWTWLLLALLILLIGIFLFSRYQHYQKRAYRREALAAIKNSADDLSDKECILLCHEMIRRCLISEQKHDLAALPSSTLIDKIDGSMPAKYQFSSLGNDFVDGPYRHHIELTPEQRNDMLKATNYWIRKHHA
jgi:hypothetical protein